MPRESLHFIVKIKVDIIRRVHDDRPALNPNPPTEFKESTLIHHVATTIDPEQLFMRREGRAETVMHIVTDSVRRILGDNMLVEVLQKTAGLLAKDT